MLHHQGWLSFLAGDQPMGKSEHNRFASSGIWNTLSLAEELYASAEIFGNRIAVVSGDRRISYRELKDIVEHIAGGLVSLGIRSGDTVMVQLPNELSFVTVSFALFRIGAVPVFALPASSRADIVALCRLAEPVAYVSNAPRLGIDHSDIFAELAVMPSVRFLISDDGRVPGTIDLRSLETSSPPVGMPFPDCQETAVLLLSGGTTGTPKLIPRSHADYAYNARAAAQRCRLTEESSYLVVLPVAHNFSLSAPGIIGVFEHGGKAVLSETPAADEAFSLVEKERITFTSLVPALLNLWLEAREWEDADLSSLCFLQVGGAHVDPAMARRVLPELGCPMMNVFGTAEGLICTTAIDDSEDVISATQGYPISEYDEVRIVDAEMHDVPQGTEGEMIVRGPYTIGGYYKDSEANKLAITQDGFYRTGDLARFDENGRIAVCGRIKEQINRAGEKIAPAEVENVLRAMPGVLDAAVTGIPDRELGERICAWLIVGDAESITLPEVLLFCDRKGLARYKWPDQLEFRDSWPLTSVGKVDKKALASSVVS